GGSLPGWGVDDLKRVLAGRKIPKLLGGQGYHGEGQRVVALLGDVGPSRCRALSVGVVDLNRPAGVSGCGGHHHRAGCFPHTPFGVHKRNSHYSLSSTPA